MLDKIVLHNRAFELKDINDRIIGKVINNTTSSGKLRSTKRGDRLAFEITLQDVSLEDKEFIINTLYPSNGFLMVVHNTEEYYVTMTDEEIEFGNRVVDIYGNTFYDDVSIYVEEVLPEIGAVIL
jgi:hypothetical protein